MSAFEDGRAAMWPAFKDAGFLVAASTQLPGCTEPTEFDVALRKPDVNPITGVQSRDYEMEYQHADAPTLAEGAEVIVDGVMYRVRSEPTIETERGDDGYFRCAYLTRVGTALAP